MAGESAVYRWWESYLVRYFLPCIAGMVIISWLDYKTEGGIGEICPSVVLIGM